MADKDRPMFHILISLIEIWQPSSVDETIASDLIIPQDKKPYLITEVESLEIDESYRKLIGTASIKFPRGTVIKKTIDQLNGTTYNSKVTATMEDSGVLITTRVDSKKAEVTDFRVGSRIRIRLGMTTDPSVAALTKPDFNGRSIFNDISKYSEYIKHLNTMFDGYITSCSIDSPIEIKCENLLSKLKKISCPNKNLKNVTVNDLFAEDGKYKLLKDTGIKLYSKTKRCNINVGDIDLNTHLTIADVLTEWKKYKLYAFFKYEDGPTIAIGRTYFSNAESDSVVNLSEQNEPVEIFFDYHVANNDLTLTNTDKTFLAVEATGLDEQDKFYHITVRRNPKWNEEQSSNDKWQVLNEVTISKKERQMGATVLSKCKGNNKVDLSSYTIIPYMSRKLGVKHDDLLKEAIQYYESYNMNGIEGTITLFGDLALKTGTKVHLNDSIHPQKNGYYLVDEVHTTFGVNGYRQRISLPYCIAKDKTENNEQK